MPKPYHSVDPNKVFRLLGPGWQVHITDHGAALPHSQMITVTVDKHLREVVEFRNQFLRFKGREMFDLYSSQTRPQLLEPQLSPYYRPRIQESATNNICDDRATKNREKAVYPTEMK